MGSELRDDRLKLIRYTVLFTRREYEHSFPEREELVPDNLDDASFAAWKTAEFIQELGRGTAPVPTKWQTRRYPPPESRFVERRNGALFLKGLPDEDKKYLRVHCRVLDRYARQRFEYEEQQIRVLQDIRDGMPRAPRPRDAAVERPGCAVPGVEAEPAPARADPFEGMEESHRAHLMAMKYMRLGFQKCSRELSDAIFEAFHKFGDVGPVKAIERTGAHLGGIFGLGVTVWPPFDPARFEAFRGRWRGTEWSYRFDAGEQPARVTYAWHVVWDGVAPDGEARTQRTVVSRTRHVTPEAVSDPEDQEVDLGLHVFRRDIGITGWLRSRIEFGADLAVITYAFGEGGFLWVGRVSEESRSVATHGGDAYWIFLQWLDADGGHYYRYGMPFEVDFEECRLRVRGEGFRKARFERVG